MKEPVAEFNSGIHLIVSYYNNSDYSKERHQEIADVLNRNIQNQLIDYLHLIVEGEFNPALVFSPVSSMFLKKLVVRKVDSQPTYQYFFDYANLALARGTVAIISNSDILFDSSLGCLRQVNAISNPIVYFGTKRLVLGLSRQPSKCHPTEYNECRQYRGSHDAFIFAPPLIGSFINQVDFVQNMLGAENRVLYLLRKMSYRLSNPCSVVKITHAHCTPNSRKVSRLASRGSRFASVDPLSVFKCGDVIY